MPFSKSYIPCIRDEKPDDDEEVESSEKVWGCLGLVFVLIPGDGYESLVHQGHVCIQVQLLISTFTLCREKRKLLPTYQQF